MKKALLFLLLISNFSFAQFPIKPQNYVTDEADLLSQSEQSQLNKKLKVLEDQTSNQIFIYITTSLEGNNLEDYSQKIFDTWKIGKKGKDNGLLISVFVQDRKFRITTGYGLEKDLPDLVCNQIQESFIIPNFKSSDYFEGLDSAIDAIISVIGGKSVEQVQIEKEANSIGTGTIITTLILLAILVLLAIYGKPKNKKQYRIVITSFIILSFLIPYILLLINANPISYNLVLSAFIISSINFIFLLLGFSGIESLKTEGAKKANKIFFILYIIIANLFFYRFIVVENLSINKIAPNETYTGVFSFLVMVVNFFHMCGVLIAITPNLPNSSKGISFGSSRSSYGSSSSWSSSSSFSSGSSFSGGGGGRSGGGGSSGSW